MECCRLQVSFQGLGDADGVQGTMELIVVDRQNEGSKLTWTGKMDRVLLDELGWKLMILETEKNV